MFAPDTRLRIAIEPTRIYATSAHNLATGTLLLGVIVPTLEVAGGGTAFGVANLAVARLCAILFVAASVRLTADALRMER